MGRVGQHYVGTYPRPLLQHGELRHEGLAVDPNPVGDLHVVLHNGAAAYTHIVPDPVLLPDQGVVAALEAPADHVPRVDNGVRADHRAVSNDGRQLAIALSPGGHTHYSLSLIHISEPTRLGMRSYA